MEAGALPRAGSGTPAQTPRLLKLAPDARLVGLVREGRVGAFEALYDRHHKGILSFCRHMLSDADEAEDAVQHTFMAAYRELADSDEPIHVRAWLYTVARNRCYSIIRGRREQPSDSIDTAATEGLATEVQRRQDLRDLVADLRRLPDEQRAALVLAELDALSHEDIAGVLGVPRDKVKALVYQARESLVAERTARDTSCSEIREQLASGRGAVLRRANLRRHLRECDGCREFRAQVETQRKQFAVLLPVLPAAALKEGLFGGAGLVIGGTAAVGGGAVAATALKTGVAKGILGAVLASVGTAGTLVFTGSGMQVKSFVHGIERAVPKFVPTSRLIEQPPPRAKPIRVTSTHPAVIRSFSPTRVVRPATASRSVPVAAVPVAAVPVTKHSREHVPARIAAPVRVPHSSQRHAGATPVAAAVRVRVPTQPTQPTAPATQVPSSSPATPAAAPTPVLSTPPAATPPTATTPAPTATPPVTAAPVAPPAATPATPAPTAPPVAVPQSTPVVPSTPILGTSEGSQSPGTASAGSQSPGSQSQSSSSTGAAASSHSVGGEGNVVGGGSGEGDGHANGQGNGNGNGWGHDHGNAYSPTGSGSVPPVTTTSTSTTTIPVPTVTTVTSTVPSTTVPVAPASATPAAPASTTPAPGTDPGWHGDGRHGDNQSGYGDQSAGAGDQGASASAGAQSGESGGSGQVGTAADGSAAPGAGSPYSH